MKSAAGHPPGCQFESRLVRVHVSLGMHACVDRGSCGREGQEAKEQEPLPRP